jgi:hypothetical protein
LYQPILKVLDESGGSARMSDVLTRVELLMQGVLKEVTMNLSLLMECYVGQNRLNGHITR